MTASNELERRLADFYATEEPPRAPEWVLSAVLATIDTTRQRRAPIRVPWRFTTMNTYAKVATAAVAVVAVGALGLAVVRPGQPGTAGDVSPGASLPPSPSASEGSGALPSAPALTETFTSSVHGISIGYPAGWTVDPAGGSASAFPWFFRDPGGDTIFEPQLADHLFLHLRSEPIGDLLADDWVASRVDGDFCPAAQPTTIDGAEGAIGPGCALAVSGDRGYVVALYLSGDDAWLPSVYDEAWFRGVVDTVRLAPASAAPPMPPLDTRYDSTVYGLSIAYPSAWSVESGTEPWISGLPHETADTIQQGSDNVFLRIASQPLGGRTGQGWANEIVGDAEWGDTCDFNIDPITIDGIEGQFVIHCPDDVMNGLVWADDRGYLIIGYGIGDIAWFKSALESVRLNPEQVAGASRVVGTRSITGSRASGSSRRPLVSPDVPGDLKLAAAKMEPSPVSRATRL